MGMLTTQDIDRLRNNGASEFEILYMDVENQKDYEPLLLDKNTPTKIIDDMVNRITLPKLKIIALKHPNISEKSQRYILEKADKKPYHEDIVEAFLSNKKPLTQHGWLKILKTLNKGNRFEIIIIKLLESQSDFFTLKNLDIIFNSFASIGINQSKFLTERLLLAIFEHKNFNVSILHGDTTKSIDIFNNTVFKNSMNASKIKNEIMVELYKITSDTRWLPSEINDLLF